MREQLYIPVLIKVIMVPRLEKYFFKKKFKVLECLKRLPIKKKCKKNLIFNLFIFRHYVMRLPYKSRKLSVLGRINHSYKPIKTSIASS